MERRTIVDYVTVRMNPSGCESINGLPSTRWILGHGAFYRLLGAAMGIRSASLLTFLGLVTFVGHGAPEPACFTNGVYNREGC
jgi:hypothetical protein